MVTRLRLWWCGLTHLADHRRGWEGQRLFVRCERCGLESSGITVGGRRADILQVEADSHESQASEGQEAEARRAAEDAGCPSTGQGVPIPTLPVPVARIGYRSRAPRAPRDGRGPYRDSNRPLAADSAVRVETPAVAVFARPQDARVRAADEPGHPRPRRVGRTR